MNVSADDFPGEHGCCQTDLTGGPLDSYTSPNRASMKYQYQIRQTKDHKAPGGFKD